MNSTSQSPNPLHLLSAHDIEDPSRVLPPWARDIFTSFCATLSSNVSPFPCIYARRALNADALRYIFVDAQPTALRDLATALGQYATIAEDLAPYTAFLAFFPPDVPSMPLNVHHDRFWRVLQYLHDHDPGPWPSHIPTSAADQLWEFCFNCVPMFVLGSNPAHNARKSRHTATFTISFQPRFMFDTLISNRTLLERSRQLIRSRVLALDGFPVHPQIGMYFEAENREWRQYVVPEDNGLISGNCPLAMTVATTTHHALNRLSGANVADTY
jgi:FPC/CPF motif-containing protein YcgG